MVMEILRGSRIENRRFT